MTTSLSHLAPLGAEKIEQILHGNDDRLKIAAVRTIAWVEALHERTKLMEARTNAYIKRCEVLNERTARTPEPTPRNSSAPSATGVHTPWRAVNTSSSPDPEDHLTLPKDSTFREHYHHFHGPKPKTKADYARMATLALNKLHDRDAEQSICNEELIVYRAYDNGSFNLATRNYHLNDIRTKHPSRELPPAKGVTLPPDSSLLPSHPYPDREGGGLPTNSPSPNSASDSATPFSIPSASSATSAVNTPKPPRLIHPTPLTPRNPKPPRDDCYNYLYPNTT